MFLHSGAVNVKNKQKTTDDLSFLFTNTNTLAVVYFYYFFSASINDQLSQLRLHHRQAYFKENLCITTGKLRCVNGGGGGMTQHHVCV